MVKNRAQSGDKQVAVNVGVNTSFDQFFNLNDLSDTESTTISTKEVSSKSLTKVRDELQNVINVMGPHTPQFSYNTSSDADNEESAFSSIAITSEETELRSGYAGYSVSGLTTLEQPTAPFVEKIQISEIPPCQCVCSAVAVQTSFTSPIAPSVTSKGRKVSTVDCKRRGIMNWIKNWSLEKLSNRTQPCKLYKIDISKPENEESPPRRLVFELVDGIPKPEMSNVATNTKFKNNLEELAYKQSLTNLQSNRLKQMKNFSNQENQKRKRNNLNTAAQETMFYDSNGNTRVDFYYFDHGNAQYFHTTDTPPILYCDVLAEKTNDYTTRFWAEIFASINVAVSFVMSFILQLFRFTLSSIIRPLTIGLMQLGSDYFFKPCLTTLFNGIIQPILIFFYNIATSLRDLCDPIAEAFGYFCREVGVVLKAIRLINYKRTDCATCQSTKKCICDE